VHAHLVSVRAGEAGQSQHHTMSCYTPSMPCTTYAALGTTHVCTAAERRLLECWVQQARRHGLRPHQYRTWIRRKTGPDLVVWRHRHDGTLGCATPCIFCQRELLRYDLRVHCSQSPSEWFSGRLDEEHAPQCKPTAGQMKLMFGQSPYPDRTPAAAPTEPPAAAGAAAAGRPKSCRRAAKTAT
jgi:hypothetical protein